MDALYSSAVFNNNFGLRRCFPWTSYYPEAPWMVDRVSQGEIDFVLSRLRDVLFCQNFVVRRIENPFIWGRYALRYEEMRVTSQSRHVDEDIVIHATSLSNAYQIAADNFNWRLVRRRRYGRGVSFAKEAGYADVHASKKEAFIVSGILVANCDFGTHKTYIPSYSSDTTVNHNRSVLVKYNDNEYYPYYIVYQF